MTSCIHRNIHRAGWTLDIKCLIVTSLVLVKHVNYKERHKIRDKITRLNYARHRFNHSTELLIHFDDTSLPRKDT